MRLRRQMLLSFSLTLLLLFPLALFVEYRLSQRLTRDQMNQQFALVAELLEEKLLEPLEEVESRSTGQGGHWAGKARLDLDHDRVLDWVQGDGSLRPVSLKELLRDLEEVPVRHGYVFLLDRHGTLVALLGNSDVHSVEIATPIVEKAFTLQETDRVLLRLDDPIHHQPSDLVLLAIPRLGLAVGVIFPEQALQETLRPLAAHLLRAALVLFGMVWVAFFLLARRVSRPLEALTDAVLRSGHGELDLELPKSSIAEVEELSGAFARMRTELADYLARLQRTTEENARVARELELARLIQGNDDLKLQLDGWTAVGKSEPAREVGGDFMDLFLLPSGRLALLVGDVSGKGIPAALHTLLARAGLKLGLSLGESPAQALRQANDLLAVDNQDSVFVTALVALFCPKSRELIWARAGHPPPLGSGGALAGPNGPPLGLLPDLIYQDCRTLLSECPYLFYTDGFSEAENAQGEFLTTSPLQKALTERGDLWQLLVAHRAGAEPNDDATAILLQPSDSPSQ